MADVEEREEVRGTKGGGDRDGEKSVFSIFTPKAIIYRLSFQQSQFVIHLTSLLWVIFMFFALVVTFHTFNYTLFFHISQYIGTQYITVRHH